MTSADSPATARPTSDRAPSRAPSSPARWCSTRGPAPARRRSSPRGSSPGCSGRAGTGPRRPSPPAAGTTRTASRPRFRARRRDHVHRAAAAEMAARSGSSTFTWDGALPRDFPTSPGPSRAPSVPARCSPGWTGSGVTIHALCRRLLAATARGGRPPVFEVDAERTPRRVSRGDGARIPEVLALARSRRLALARGARPGGIATRRNWQGGHPARGPRRHPRRQRTIAVARRGRRPRGRRPSAGRTRFRRRASRAGLQLVEALAAEAALRERRRRSSSCALRSGASMTA